MKSKLSLDIKMGNLWQYKNHHFKWKYYLVLLQERSEIIQFKSGHPVTDDGKYKLSIITEKIIKSIFSADYISQHLLLSEYWVILTHATRTESSKSKQNFDTIWYILKNWRQLCLIVKNGLKFWILAILIILICL